MRLDSTDSRAIKAYSTLEDTFNTVHCNKYDYTKSVYKTARKHMTVTCPIHGDWEITPDNHKRFGCPKCDTSTKIDTKEFIVRARIQHGTYYTYSSSIYVNSSTRLTITCPIHGDFEQRPNDHLQGKGCSKCANLRKKVHYNGKHYTDVPTTLYYLEIVPGVYKIGITTRTVKSRFRKTKHHKTILEVHYNDGSDAYAVEQSILSKISNIGVFEALKTPVAGYTEMSLRPFLYTAMQSIKGTNYTSLNWS